jgi:1-acyl-sn-glycerol-3-phosphate acyltransferase
MSREYRLYKFFRALFSVVLAPFYPIRVHGRENMPDGAAIVCGNHSHWSDPVLIIFAIGSRCHLHMMAKAELFLKPVIGRFLNSVGMFPVDRGSNDISSVRKVIRYLKAGEKVGIFPEGTRVTDEKGGDPRNGAVYFAAKLGVPIVPVYIPRNRKLFRRVDVVIGEPYMISSGTKDTETLNNESSLLMARIESLKERIG